MNGMGASYKRTLQMNRNEHRRVSVECFLGPTIWGRMLKPLFDEHGIGIRQYGQVWRKRMNATEMKQIKIPESYLVRHIPGDKQTKTRDITIFGKDVVFKYSEVTYRVRLEYYVKNKKGKIPKKK